MIARLFPFLLLATPAMAGDLVTCDTSLAGDAVALLYDPEVPALQENTSLREKLYGSRGTITCPGLVTLRALTPDLTDAERGPFCLQWDDTRKTYIGYDLGPRDAWLGCKAPGRSFCEKVNRSKQAAARWAGVAGEAALQAGSNTALQAAGATSVHGSAALIGEKLVELGATAGAGAGGAAVLGAAAVTAVAVGGAVYVCSDSGAAGADVQAEP